MRFLNGLVGLIHHRLRRELQERGAVMQGLEIPPRVRYPLEVQAELLNERPLVVHTPLSIILPLPSGRIFLHKRLHHACPSRKAASGWAIRGWSGVGAGEHIGHGTLVAIIV